MSKKRKQPKRGRLGTCLAVILIGACGLIYIASNPTPKSSTGASATGLPAPDSATPQLSAANIAAQQSDVVKPSATITDTPQPAATQAGQPTSAGTPSFGEVTPRPPASYYVRSVVNARICPDTTCQSLGKYQQGQYITVDGDIRGGIFQGDNLWYRTSFNGQTGYVVASLLLEGDLVAQPQSQVQAATPTPGFLIPENCSTAVAEGLSPQQAAQYPGLDRNGNGVACYGS